MFWKSWYRIYRINPERINAKIRKVRTQNITFHRSPAEKSVHWVNPILVAQIKYSELTENKQHAASLFILG
ncbi:MAG: hypothetical protein IPI60_20990 [Saprospiraceae bacterium]|nr:hypothetical protein [Saprospiraceae bacterium]